MDLKLFEIIGHLKASNFYKDNNYIDNPNDATFLEKAPEYIKYLLKKLGELEDE